MANLTKQDILKRINNLIEPEQQGLPKLLDLLMNQPQPYIPPQPSGQVMPTAEATTQNIAASIAEPAPKQSVFARFPYARSQSGK